MKLIERERFLEELSRLWQRVGSGHGCTALITGEAGIGKTALIEQFTQERGAGTRILYGVCDALFTPRALGPLHDIALQLKGDLLHALENGADRLLIFSLFLQELQNDSPTLVVFEDIHWADEATLDLIKFIGRPIASARALLIFSCRDDEIGRNHPVRIALGDLPGATVTRIALPRLSKAGVVELARPKRVSSEWLYSVTGGNPLLADQTGEAVHWGEQAIHLAESLGDQETLIHALNNVGSAWFIANDVERGEPLLDRSLRLALENGFEEHAARAYTNLATSSVRRGSCTGRLARKRRRSRLLVERRKSCRPSPPRLTTRACGWGF